MVSDFFSRPNMHSLLLVVLNANYFRSAHLYLFLNGVSSISKEGVEFNIMRASGTVSVYKEICPYYLLCPYILKYIIGNLDLITLYKHSK